METKYKELELVLTFLGITFIDYKGHRTSNGFQPSKTIGEIKEIFGREVMTSGQFIEDIKFFDFHTWNDLMPVVHKCLKICHDNMLNEWENSFADKFLTLAIEPMFKEVIDFINFYNENKTI